MCLGLRNGKTAKLLVLTKSYTSEGGKETGVPKNTPPPPATILQDSESNTQPTELF